MVPVQGRQLASAQASWGNGASPPALKPLKRDTLRDDVVRAIRDAIIQGRLRPGEKVPEEELAQQLRVSRTPVREAIRVLEGQGLVLVRPKRGTYIAMPDREDAADGLAVRIALEELAVAQAIERLTESEWDDLCDQLESILAQMAGTLTEANAIRGVELDIEFHATVIRAARNRHLWRSWHAVGIPFLVWSPERGMYPTSEPDIVKRHRYLLDAIRSKELARCADAIRSHIERKLADIPG
ncbi:MAG TPA: GntR family transcriptional regulator [Streptosporangiaceae bacterium]|nr:GntR family transcriptional regulator [Streptosporangiaceae bacterium]